MASLNYCIVVLKNKTVNLFVHTRVANVCVYLMYLSESCDSVIDQFQEQETPEMQPLSVSASGCVR